jgi:hypothetical protein
MPRFSSLASLVAALAALTVGGGAAADDPRKDALVNDPAVKGSLEQGSTPLGRTPPNLLPAESTPEMQRAIDRAHGGSTGVTRGDGATRRPDDQPAGVADAPGGAPAQLGPVVEPPR